MTGQDPHELYGGAQAPAGGSVFCVALKRPYLYSPNERAICQLSAKKNNKIERGQSVKKEKKERRDGKEKEEKQVFMTDFTGPVSLKCPGVSVQVVASLLDDLILECC